MNEPQKRELKKRLAARLKEIAAEHGSDLVSDAYATALRDALNERLEARLGRVAKSSYISSILPYPREFLYADHSHEMSEWEWHRPPGADHDSIREKDGKKTFITQPYGLSWRCLKDLVAYCEAHELEATINVGAPYSATACLLVEIRHGKDSK